LIILDENILEGQRLRLESLKITARQIGVDIGRKGMKDEEIIVLLRAKRRVTFFTRDAGFYLRGLRHSSYCLAVMSVGQNEVAVFIRRFLRHPSFDTQARRMGKVVRVSPTGLVFWRLRSQLEVHTGWMPSTH
jgi:hypothetical protein